MTRRVIRRDPRDWRSDTIHAARVGAVVLLLLLLALSAVRSDAPTAKGEAYVESR